RRTQRLGREVWRIGRNRWWFGRQQLVHDAEDALFEHRDVKIDDQAEPKVLQPQVPEDFHAVDRGHLLLGLEIHDHLLADDQVRAQIGREPHPFWSETAPDAAGQTPARAEATRSPWPPRKVSRSIPARSRDGPQWPRR